MNRKPQIFWAFIILLIIMVMSGGTYYVYAMQTVDGEQALAENIDAPQTAVAQEGDLAVLASGTGEMIALDQTTLKFDESGTLVDLLVEVGDQVSAGDLLARLQVNKTEAQLAADVAAAKLAAVEAQQTLDTLYAEAEITSAQALYDLETAQEELVDLLNNDLEVAQALQAVALAEEAIDDAEMALYILDSTPSDEDIYTAYASLLFKEKTYNELVEQLEKLEYEYIKAEGKMARERVKAQIEKITAQMYNAQIAYEESLYQYETIDDPANPIDLNLAQTQMDAAQAQLDQARLDLAEAQQGAPAGDIALVEAKLTQAQAEFERCQGGPDPQDVNLAETSLAAAQLALELAQQEQLIMDLVAPIDGTVLSIEAVVNQVVDGDAILTLADTSQPLIEVSMDETDFQSVQVGNRIEVVFDALPDDVFDGVIVEVFPEMENTFGSQAIKALAVLEETILTQSKALPIGLGAAVDVFAGEVTDAVLVPIEALYETTPGRYTVYVLEDETFKAREVTVGLMDYTSAAITNGLDVGEIVAIENVVTE